MPSGVVNFWKDLTPLDWILNGTSHKDSLNSDNPTKNIYVVGPDVEDVLRLIPPIGSNIDNVGELLKLSVTVRLNAVLGDDARGVTFTFTKNGGSNDWDYRNYEFVPNPNPHTVSFDLDMPDGYGWDQAKWCIFKLLSYTPGGATWPVGSGVVQIYDIDLVMHWNLPTVAERIDEIRAPISALSVIDAPISEGRTIVSPVPALSVITAPVPDERIIRAPIDPDRVVDG